MGDFMSKSGPNQLRGEEFLIALYFVGQAAKVG